MDSIATIKRIKKLHDFKSIDEIISDWMASDSPLQKLYYKLNSQKHTVVEGVKRETDNGTN